MCETVDDRELFAPLFCRDNDASAARGSPLLELMRTLH